MSSISASAFTRFVRSASILSRLFFFSFFILDFSSSSSLFIAASLSFLGNLFTIATRFKNLNSFLAK